MYGLMIPVALGCRAVLLEVWDAARAVALIGEPRVTFTMAPKPFLADPCPACRRSSAPANRSPAPLVEGAQRVLGETIVSAWGMSEIAAVTRTLLDDDPRRAVETDGCPLPGTEVKVVDAAGDEVPVGEPGRLLVRTCSRGRSP